MMMGQKGTLAVLAASVENAPSSDLGEDPELIADFLLEAREHLAGIEQNLLELERNPGQVETVHATFRSFHTIKGLAGFLGQRAILRVAHETETLLDLARSGSLAINATLIDVILRSVDYLIGALNRLEGGQGSEQQAPEALMGTLFRASRGFPAPPGEPGSLTEVSEPATAEFSATAPNAPAAGKSRRSAALKVDADKIEHLTDLAGEFVIAQSMLRQNLVTAGLTDPALLRSLGHLSRIAQEVQKTAVSIRMAPVRSLFQKMSRVVRDVARKSGKRVSLALSGDDAEMDRKILEGLAEPFLHMVRNAVDHGLETPGERVSAGKKPVGAIRLLAEREAGNIVIEISDDGRGLNPGKILKKAIEQGLVSENAGLSPDEIYRLIFEPGLSTAEELTEFSGRGVGMDVVRRQVELMRGRVEIRSAPGRGSSFTVRIPAGGFILGDGRAARS